MKRETAEFVHEGKYSAEIPVAHIEDETGWSPYLSIEHATKLDAVRQAATLASPP